jgi:hypothetical protein
LFIVFRRFLNLKYLSLFVFVVIYACSTPAKKEEKAGVLHSALKGKFVDFEFGSCDTVNYSGVVVSLHLWEPTGPGDVLKQIKATISEKVVNRINSYSDSASIAQSPAAKNSAKAAYEVFASNYQSFKKDFPEAPGCWEVAVSGDTVMVTPKLMLYQMDQYSFTGGAHPNSFTSYHVFDLETGYEIESEALIADSVALLKKVELAFRREEKLDAKTDLEEAGYFLMNNQFFIPANYTFTRGGVLFYYNPYEIAAYARGPISFTIPYSELKGIIREDLIF